MSILAKKCLYGLGLLLSVLYMPFGVTFVIALLGLTIFDMGIITIMLLFVADLLYGAPLGIYFFPFPFLLTTIAIIIFFAAYYIKPRLYLRNA